MVRVCPCCPQRAEFEVRLPPTSQALSTPSPFPPLSVYREIIYIYV